MTASPANVMTSKTIYNSSSIYNSLSRSEATARYSLQNTLDHITRAKYHALNGRLGPECASSASGRSSTSSFPTTLPSPTPYRDALLKNTTINSISAAYYPVFQRALPYTSSATSPSLISDVYDYSSSPTSSDWDGCSLMFRGDGDDSDTGLDTDVDDAGSDTLVSRWFSSPEASPVVSPQIPSLPTPCPSSPLLGLSVPGTPFSPSTGAEGRLGYRPGTIGVLPERPAAAHTTGTGVVGSDLNLGQLMKSLKCLEREEVSSSDVLGAVAADMEEDDEDWSDGIIGKAWNRSSNSSSSTPSSPISTFSFNPIFLQSSTTSTSASSEPSESESSVITDVKDARAKAKAAADVDVPVWAFHGLDVGDKSGVQFKSLYKDPVWPGATSTSSVSVGWPTVHAGCQSASASASSTQKDENVGKKDKSQDSTEKKGKNDDKTTTDTSTSADIPASTTSTTAAWNPFAHNPKSSTLYGCSCSDCHWTLLWMSACGSGGMDGMDSLRREIEKVDDERATLMSLAWSKGVVGSPHYPYPFANLNWYGYYQ